MCLLVTDLIIALITVLGTLAAVGVFNKDFPFVGPPTDRDEP